MPKGRERFLPIRKGEGLDLRRSRQWTDYLLASSRRKGLLIRLSFLRSVLPVKPHISLLEDYPHKQNTWQVLLGDMACP